MAHVHLGIHYFLEESADLVARARDCFAQARAHLTGLTDRERDVVETLDLWGNGRVRQAMARACTPLSPCGRERSSCCNGCTSFILCREPRTNCVTSRRQYSVTMTTMPMCWACIALVWKKPMILPAPLRQDSKPWHATERTSGPCML